MNIKTCLRKLLCITLALTAVAFVTLDTRASDPIGIYAIIDKVVLEPGDKSPERIQIWGSFSLAEGRGETYATPVSGYLYYKLPQEKQEAARKEWSDLLSVAGKEQVVGFGSRWKDKGKVREADEKTAMADSYPIAFGLQKIRRLEYEPVKKLLVFHKEKQAPAKKVSTAPGIPGDVTSKEIIVGQLSASR